jgi:hypothetical protein
MNTSNHIIYTADDIEKYLSGKLTPAQMHAIEKAALDDDFLAEAIEGYSSIDQKDWQKELAAAKQKLFTVDEKEEAKVIAITKPANHWYKIAAAIVLLLGCALAYNLITKKPIAQPEIAKVTEPVKIDTPATTSNTQIAEVILPETKIAPQGNVQTPTQNYTLTTAGKTKVVTTKIDVAIKDSNFVYTPSATATNIVSGEVAVNEVDTKYKAQNWAKEKEAEAKPSAAPITQNNAEYYRFNNSNAQNNAIGDDKLKNQRADYDLSTVAKKRTVTNNSFISQVFAQDNTPLPFANISIKSENFGTYADVNGNFRLISTDTVVTVDVKSAGYANRSYTLNSKTPLNKIVLQPEVIDAKNSLVLKDNTAGRKSRRAIFLKDSIVNVAPKDGWANYETYVTNNMTIPDDILDKEKQHGQMEVTFNVQKNGAITDIKIDKSACENCDENAVKKLIEQGPEWKKLKKGKAGAARLRVQF